MSMNRRDIFRMIPKGAAAAAMAGAVATEVVNEAAAQPVVEEVKKSKPPEKVSFSIQQQGELWLRNTNGEWKKVVIDPKPREVDTPRDYGPNGAISSASSGSYLASGFNGPYWMDNRGMTSTLSVSSIVNITGNGEQKVGFGVNDEGELWLRNTNGEWKKVVTE